MFAIKITRKINALANALTKKVLTFSWKLALKRADVAVKAQTRLKTALAKFALKVDLAVDRAEARADKALAEAAELRKELEA